MFRDLKEYQEIAKIYADKVSKPEDLDENRNTRGQELRMQRDANKPKTRAEVGLPPKKKISPFERKFGAEKNEKRLIQSGLKKKIPTTAEIRAKNPNVVPGTRVNEVGAKGGGKPSSGDLSMFKDKKPEVSTMTKQGKPRTKAQMMAAKRIADGKSIADVKAANTASMKAKAAERNQKFQDAKKSGNLAQFRKDNPKMSGADKAKAMAKARIEAKKAAMSEGMNPVSGRDTVNEPGALKVYRNVRTVGNLLPAIGKTLAGDKSAFKKMEKKEVERYKNPKGIERVATGIADKMTGDKFDFDKKGSSKTKKEEFTPYDIVLEYLLSTEQAATIEEANYVMTEMDAETIQSIVEMEVNRADIIGGTKAAKDAAAGKGKGLYTPGKGVTKDFKLDPAFKLPKA